MKFSTITEIIEDIRQGKMVIVVDDEDRENEGDLVMAACFITPKDTNFMATYGRGLICVPMGGRRLDELNLGPMVDDNKAPFGTAWTISIDAKEGITTDEAARRIAETRLSGTTR